MTGERLSQERLAEIRISAYRSHDFQLLAHIDAQQAEIEALCNPARRTEEGQTWAREKVLEALEHAAMSEVVRALSVIAYERGFPRTYRNIEDLAAWMECHPEVSSSLRSGPAGSAA